MGNKSLSRILFWRLFGLMIFLVVLALANYLIFQIHVLDSLLNRQVVVFLNGNILLFVFISLAFLFGELFSALFFPFNLPAPLFNAAGAVFLAAFLFRVFELAGSITGKDFLQAFRGFSFLAYPLIFAVVLFGGYILIFLRFFESCKPEKTKKTGSSGAKSWGDVGVEFRQMLYDLFSLVRESVNRKRDDAS
jgi:hypothetical protein